MTDTCCAFLVSVVKQNHEAGASIVGNIILGELLSGSLWHPSRMQDQIPVPIPAVSQIQPPATFCEPFRVHQVAKFASISFLSIRITFIRGSALVFLDLHLHP